MNEYPTMKKNLEEKLNEITQLKKENERMKLKISKIDSIGCKKC